MNTVKPLLPSGSSLLEKRAAECLQETVTNRIDFENLINPHKCPVKLLPYLAWALSVDYWEEYWSEQQKRQAIIDSYHNHQRKGTVGAVRRIVESLGYDFEIREWFKEKRERQAGTFRIFVELKDKGISEKIYQELERLLEDAKPVSRHITELAVSATSRGKANIFSAAHSGEIILIKPR
ncbi:phage tail protein I [Mannheimia haemolytica]|uniref:phage tail protein I n=1 Tax=Mannheimia haemolytica TaxID=75985 RepID=UPI001377B218|nr:phage tail protein I [Mannheimia haemolytica]MDW0617589.1 phage tail protein I [Mannheimia haemolytica]NBB66959.1 phage tail protein I [Mannheimia haemolytica]